jgi:hypothetical protein
MSRQTRNAAASSCSNHTTATRCRDLPRLPACQRQALDLAPTTRLPRAVATLLPQLPLYPARPLRSARPLLSVASSPQAVSAEGPLLPRGLAAVPWSGHPQAQDQAVAVWSDWPRLFGARGGAARTAAGTSRGHARRQIVPRAGGARKPYVRRTEHVRLAARRVAGR